MKQAVLNTPKKTPGKYLKENSEQKRTLFLEVISKVYF